MQDPKQRIYAKHVAACLIAISSAWRSGLNILHRDAEHTLYIFLSLVGAVAAQSGDMERQSGSVGSTIDSQQESPEFYSQVTLSRVFLSGVSKCSGLFPLSKVI